MGQDYLYKGVIANTSISPNIDEIVKMTSKIVDYYQKTYPQ